MLLDKLMRLLKLMQGEDEGIKSILFNSVHHVLDSALRVAEQCKADRQEEADKIIDEI